MKEIIYLILSVLSTIGDSISDFNINLSNAFSIGHNVFFLGFITAFEIYILCNILFFGKIIFKGFIKQGFVIMGLAFTLFYKLDMPTLTGVYTLLACFGILINKGISDCTFMDLFNSFGRDAEDYVRVKVSGGLNDEP